MGAEYKGFEDKEDINRKYNSRAIYITNTNKFFSDKTILSQALRYDKYSDFDNKTTGKIGIKQYIIDDKHGTIDVDGVLDFVAKNYMLLAEIDAKNKDVVKNDPKKLLETLTEICFSQYQMRLNKDIDHAKIVNYERSVLLGVIDYTWINHIDAMTKLRNGIYLRAYAQKNPLSEYTEEAFYMFEQMKLSIVDMISKNIVHMGIRPGSSAEENIPHLKLEVEFK